MDQEGLLRATARCYRQFNTAEAKVTLLRPEGRVRLFWAKLTGDQYALLAIAPNKAELVYEALSSLKLALKRLQSEGKNAQTTKT